jgi:hypothetical protein
MCKKVAQLTRVIFYLNTKNDEYESNLKAVVNAYESELDNTVREVPLFLLRPITSSKSTRTLQSKQTKAQNLRRRSKRYKTLWKSKKKSLIRSSRSTVVQWSSVRPSKPLKLAAN